MVKWTFLLLAAIMPAWAADPPSGEEMIRKIAAQDKLLVARRAAFDYDIAITRDKLNADKSVASTASEKVTMRGNVAPSYKTRGDQPEDEAKQQSREEPFELLKIIDHYTYTVEGSETVDGVDCWRIAFTPKPDQPYENREEKVLNNTSGHIWASKADYSLIRNEGSLMHPVSVAWIFATLHEMEFRFDATRMPNGDYGPGRLVYRYLVHIPFTHLHERDTRQMSNYRPHEAASKSP
jgi:hypothetical protein